MTPASEGDGERARGDAGRVASEPEAAPFDPHGTAAEPAGEAMLREGIVSCGPPAVAAGASHASASAADRGCLDDVAVIIPALNEAPCLDLLLPLLTAMEPGWILVCDNGSTDGTRDVVAAHGARWVFEPRRGYGAACQAGLRALPRGAAVVAFVDADLSDDVTHLVDLVGPIRRDEADLVMAARVPALRERGATTLAQSVANHVFPVLIKAGWGHAYSDLGPFRAIRRSALDAMMLRDHAFGWTIEMQVRALELGLRVREVPLAYRKRVAGRSKIGRSLPGAIRAAYWMTRTLGSLWLTKAHRMRRETRSSG
ncbi:MAG: glycosyltransferase family 2 protein [Phycisphaerae bacterium]